MYLIDSFIAVREGLDQDVVRSVTTKFHDLAVAIKRSSVFRRALADACRSDLQKYACDALDELVDDKSS